MQGELTFIFGMGQQDYLSFPGQPLDGVLQFFCLSLLGVVLQCSMELMFL